MSANPSIKSADEITAENVTSVISRHLLVDVFPFILDIEKSAGNYLYDAVSKRPLLDCFSFIASNPLGYNHPKMNDAEFERKLLRVAKLKPSNSDLYSVEMAEFVDSFSRLALPVDFPHLFFIEGGTLANENALKAAFDWKVRLNMKSKYSEERGHQVLHFKEAFHGRSGYALSLTNTADPKKYKYFPRFDWPRVTNPKCTFPLTPGSIEGVAAHEAQAIAEIEQAFAERTDHIAAIIIEPIQGEGGDNHFRPEFHQALRKLADKHGAMLIYDEVQTGVGLTGKMWAFQHYGIVPDMVTFGKKMQVCGFFCGKRIDQAENNVFVEKSRINSTWGGNLVDMVRAQRYLEIIAEDNLVENARMVGEILLRELKALCDEFPNLIGGARGKGLMCAFDVVSTEKRDALIKETLKHGAIVLGCGTRSVRVRPSLTFRESEVGELVGILRASLKGM